MTLTIKLADGSGRTSTWTNPEQRIIDRVQQRHGVKDVYEFEEVDDVLHEMVMEESALEDR